MKPSRQPPSAVAASMFCAGLVAAQFVAGKAVRDAIYLTNLDVASLPHIVVATSIVSIVLVVASSKGFGRFSPAALVPGAFAASALLFVAEWMMSSVAPVASARVIYLHVSGLGPMLGSGFWLIATERFDPHTAKRRFSQITGAGTAGSGAGCRGTRSRAGPCWSTGPTRPRGRSTIPPVTRPGSVTPWPHWGRPAGSGSST